MRHDEGTFKGVRDTDIYYQCWRPDGEIKAGLILVHGLAEHSGRYANLVERLVPLGYAIYALDHIGHGRSGGTRVYVDRFADYTETLKIFVGMVHGWLPEKPLYLIGHSMGALICVVYLIEHQENFTGAVLSGPLFGVSEEISPITIRVGKLFSTVMPKLGLVQLEAEAISRDPAVVRAYVDDPLVHSGKMTARLAAEILRTIQVANLEASAITLPILILQGDEDRLVDPGGASLLYNAVHSTDKRLITYPGLYHEVFNEPEREQVLDDVEQWLALHIAS